jgi:hypothetical protein
MGGVFRIVVRYSCAVQAFWPMPACGRRQDLVPFDPARYTIATWHPAPGPSRQISLAVAGCHNELLSDCIYLLLFLFLVRIPAD